MHIHIESSELYDHLRCSCYASVCKFSVSIDIYGFFLVSSFYRDEYIILFKSEDVVLGWRFVSFLIGFSIISCEYLRERRSCFRSCFCGFSSLCRRYGRSYLVFFCLLVFLFFISSYVPFFFPFFYVKYLTEFLCCSDTCDRSWIISQSEIFSTNSTKCIPVHIIREFTPCIFFTSKYEFHERSSEYI